MVSICTACYNHEKFLNDYFYSIIYQTYNNIELIIIDDCSTDNSVQVINNWFLNKDFKSRVKSFKFIQNDINMGICKSLNKLINLSNGKYIKFLASDDMMNPNFIEYGVDFFENNPNYLLFFSNGWIIDKNDKYSKTNMRFFKKFFHRKDSLGNSPDFFVNFKQLMEETIIIPAPTVMFQKECFNKYGYFDESLFYEDYEYWLRVSLHTKIPYFNRTMVYYRVHEKSGSHTRNPLVLDKWFKSSEKIKLKYIVKVKSIKNRKKVLSKFYKQQLYKNILLSNKPISIYCVKMLIKIIIFKNC